MLKELLKNKIFKSEINNFYKENKSEVLDIILFGSTIRGKDKPKDIDILLLFKDNEDLDISYNLKRRLEKINLIINIITKDYNSLTKEDFNAKESILSEGYSLVNNKFISEEYGYSNFILFRYELKGFNNSNRIRFHYSLNGRYEAKGMLKELGLIKFSDSILLSPIQNSNQTREYLESWGIKFISVPILIPTRVNNILNP